jgi:hypothetical protein
MNFQLAEKINTKYQLPTSYSSKKDGTGSKLALTIPIPIVRERFILQNLAITQLKRCQKMRNTYSLTDSK